MDSSHLTNDIIIKKEAQAKAILLKFYNTCSSDPILTLVSILPFYPLYVLSTSFVILKLYLPLSLPLPPFPFQGHGVAVH